ncbi:MAG: DUF3416 domain-containing protein, partial [Fibrobacter sp.]|nr:DUF3416 domain-containing protein [Fibrobacter sp.]
MEIDGRRRVVIENVAPGAAGGEYALKRVEGDLIEVSADILCDGHDAVAARILYKRETDSDWETALMEPLGNDRWAGIFHTVSAGYYQYTVQGWVDHFQSWQQRLLKKFTANQELQVELAIGVSMLENAAKRVEPEAGGVLLELAERIDSSKDITSAVLLATGKELSAVMKNNPDTSLATLYQPLFTILVERQKALFSTWYEFFPRSSGSKQGQSGTFSDCEKLLPYISSLGFDVLYFPPIHPIGLTNRKGRNNSVSA